VNNLRFVITAIVVISLATLLLLMSVLFKSHYPICRDKLKDVDTHRKQDYCIWSRSTLSINNGADCMSHNYQQLRELQTTYYLLNYVLITFQVINKEHIFKP
jgi:hypothetical protein